MRSQRIALGLALAALVESAPALAEPPPQAASNEANQAEDYRPILAYRFRGLEIAAPIMLAGRLEGVKSFPTDRDGASFQSGAALSPLVRVGVRFRSVKPLAGMFMFLAEYEHDVITGTWTQNDLLQGEGMPNGQSFTTQVRKGFGRFSVGPYFTVGGGLMVNHWGLGLIANDGAHGWEPGSARFIDARNGDLVLRGFVATGPLTDARLVTTFAIDKVRSDDVLLEGDSAYQFIASTLVGYERPNQIGFFFVHREQTHADKSFLQVNVADVAGKATIDLRGLTLTLSAEGAVVFGRTNVGPTVEVPESRVLQLGGVVRASLASGRMGGVLDVIYASGDSNAYDGKVTGFKTDPNFDPSLLLFRYVYAAQTGRGVATASDPKLSAVPPLGVERLASRGGITNTLAVFPRFWVRPVKGLEAYGGVLFAAAPEKISDALNTRLAGGSPRNALDARPGAYWGTEIDVGLRYRVILRGMELSAGVEGGLLLPGSALNGSGTPTIAIGPVYGGRFMVGYRL